MTIPHRGTTGDGTYFITASTFEKQCLLQSEFVVMPNHFHLLITPQAPVTLERAMQFVKGGFSFRAKKELGFVWDIWQTSFYDRRVRDAGEYVRFRHYIHMNPVRRGLVSMPEEFRYSSAKLRLDGVPQGLKPAA